DSVISLS
nr:Chain A, DSVISLS segment from Superoxide dismutase [Cu-Zn] [Homo sapiens]